MQGTPTGDLDNINDIRISNICKLLSLPLLLGLLVTAVYNVLINMCVTFFFNYH